MHSLLNEKYQLKNLFLKETNYNYLNVGFRLKSSRIPPASSRYHMDVKSKVSEDVTRGGGGLTLWAQQGTLCDTYISGWKRLPYIIYTQRQQQKSFSFVQTLTEPPNVDGGRKYLYILNKKKEEKVGDVYKCYQCHVSVNDFVLAILNFPTHSPKIPQLLSITNPPTL